MTRPRWTLLEDENDIVDALNNGERCFSATHQPRGNDGPEPGGFWVWRRGTKAPTGEGVADHPLPAPKTFPNLRKLLREKRA